MFALANLYFYNQGWNQGYTLGRLNELGKSIISRISIELYRTSHFTPQFKNSGYCNNCGKDILDHCGPDLRCCHEN